MSTEQRVLVCRLLEKMENQDAYNKRLGVENVSTFHGRQIIHDTECFKKKGKGFI